MFLVNIVIETNYSSMFYASYNKVHNFNISQHHDIKFINRLFLKLMNLCKALLNISHILKWYKK
jgi:hypothetical protein